MSDVRHLGLSAAVACALAAGTAAQTSSTPPATTPPDQMTTITVTGCVQRRTTSAPSATPQAIGATGAQQGPLFVLANARGDDAPTGTPEAVVVTSIVTSYQLSGDDQEVAKNLGRRVEITGTVDRRETAIDHAVTGTTGAAPLPTLTIAILNESTGACEIDH